MSEPRIEEMKALACEVWGQPIRKKPNEWRFGRDSQGKPNDRFSLNLTTGAWYDHKDAKGGGYRQLRELVYGPSTEEEPVAPGVVGEGTKQPIEERWEPMMPPPPGCKPPTEAQLKCTALYEYCDADDALLHYIRRYEHINGKRTKTFAPLTYGRLWHGELYVEGWHDKAPDKPRPLYRLNALSHAKPDAIVLLCEGEKATEAAQRLFPDMVAMCWPGGAKAIEQADSGPLKGREIVIWPDADESGAKAAHDIKRKFKAAAILNTAGLDEGFDAADLELDPAIEDHGAWLRARVQLPDPIHRHQLPEIPWKWERGSDWAGIEVPDRLWILPGWIPRRQTTGLYGVGGVNKTDFLLQLAMAYSKGLIFAGHQLDHGRVVCLFCEDESEEIRRRANRIARHYGFYDMGDFPDFHYVSLVGYDLPYFVRFKGIKAKAQTALKRADKKIEDTTAKLMILDTAPHFFGGNDISRLEVSTFLRKLDGISLSRDCAVLFAAHPSQSGVKSGRMTAGSTHWEGGVRARIALTRPEEEGAEDQPPGETNDRRLTLWKSNYAAPGKTLDLVWDKGVFTTAALDPERARARGPMRNDACDEKFLELLRAVVAQGGYVNDSVSHPARYAPAVFAARPDGKTFSKFEYHRAMTRLIAAKRLRYDRKRDRVELVEVSIQT